MTLAPSLKQGITTAHDAGSGTGSFWVEFHPESRKTGGKLNREIHEPPQKVS
jgi:hypothetical protein